MRNLGCRLLVLLPLLASVPAASQTSVNQFVGKVVVEWLDETGPDRKMKLLQPFAYVDPNGKRWDVPAGTVIDGASIPQIFWTSVGSPFTGDYRKASVIHDRYCVTKSETWRAVHRVFYDAMITAGVPKLQAKSMYAAVYGAGPRWERVAMSGIEGNTVQIVDITTRFSEQEYREVSNWIASDDPSLDEIERRVDVSTPD